MNAATQSPHARSEGLYPIISAQSEDRGSATQASSASSEDLRIMSPERSEGLHLRAPCAQPGSLHSSTLETH